MYNDPFVELIHEHEALKRWTAGEIPKFSSDIGGFVTCGYGKLNDYGEWQFPLYPGSHYLELLKERKNGKIS